MWKLPPPKGYGRGGDKSLYNKLTAKSQPLESSVNPALPFQIKSIDGTGHCKGLGSLKIRFSFCQSCLGRRS
jgi:hypothetical protein